MERVRFGVIGLGRFGEVHCEALAGLAQAELYALCTRTEPHLRQLAARFGVSRAYTDYQHLLADPRVDAVSVVTMWDQHTGPALAALRAGKHVFIEKPLASTVEDCETIVRAANETRLCVMVGHICRFNPRYAAAKREIQAGALGQIVSIYARRNIPASVSATVLQKIGPIAGDGVHDTDLMLWFTGARIESVYAQTHSVRGLRHPDIGWTMYRFDTGAIGVCENAWFLPPKTPYRIDERMEIIGTEGSIHIQDGPPDFSVCDNGGWRTPDTTYWPVLHDQRGGALREELAYFTGCILAGRKPVIITLEEAMAAAKASLAATLSASTGTVVRLI